MDKWISKYEGKKKKKLDPYLNPTDKKSTQVL